MDEPPIASPFGKTGASTGPTPTKASLPGTLKLMVGISLLMVVIAAFQYVKMLQHTPLVVSGNWFTVLFWVGRMAIRALLLVGLLWRSRLCWWGTQLSNIWNIFISIRILLIFSSRPTAVIPYYLPSLTVELALFIYLLLPPVRRIFFSKT